VKSDVVSGRGNRFMASTAGVKRLKKETQKLKKIGFQFFPVDEQTLVKMLLFPLWMLFGRYIFSVGLCKLQINYYRRGLCCY